jgi:CheY-like chemotaxis protein
MIFGLHSVVKGLEERRISKGGLTEMRILVIDDEKLPRELLAEVLAWENHEVLQAVDGRQGMDMIDSEGRFDAVFTDMRMPEAYGDEVIRHIRQVSPETPVILVSGTLRDDPEVTACDPDEVLEKPYNTTDVLVVLNSAIENRRSAFTGQQT